MGQRAIFDGRIVDAPELEAVRERLFQNQTLIETMRWEVHGIALWPWHWNRLSESAALVGGSPPGQQELLESIRLLRSVTESDKALVVRFEWTPGYQDSHYLIESRELPPLPDKPLEIGTGTSARLPSSPYARLKSNARKPYLAVQREMKMHGWYDGLLLNAAGRIAESTISNVFWIRNRQVYTPPLTEYCVAGVFRAFLLGLNEEWRVEEHPLSAETLRSADEIFLTNAVRGIQPIGYWEGKKFECRHGEHLKRLACNRLGWSV